MSIVSANDRQSGWNRNSGNHSAEQGSPRGDMAFDRWLVHHLERLYDPVTREALPDDLIRLLDEKKT
jgi:hypothetical protein